MGSYAECWLGSFYVGSTKNEIDPYLMSLFRSADKRIITEKKSNLPNQLSQWIEYIDEEDVINVVYYSVPLPLVRDRLNLKGYTLETSKLTFNRYLEGKVREYEEYSKGKYGGYAAHRLQIIQSMNVDVWLSTLKEIHEKGLKHGYSGGPIKRDESLIDYMLQEDWYGFPGPDLNAALRLAIEVLPESENYIYDVTELVISEYYDIEDDFVEIALNSLSADYYSGGKTIILTEGRSDTWILSESMELLFPHLADYFTFMDFDNAKVGGGVGNLANIVKAFSGAGIINKIIAIFDNDTAAKTAIHSLEQVSIPKNIKILQLPDISLLNDYPTLGPSGLIRMNVNGMAGSIELYLGSDVLKGEHGEYYCIQWTGYDVGIARYQGEILNKNQIQNNFKRKLETCKSDRNMIANTDWSGMTAILERIFSSFHQIDGEEIISGAYEYYEGI